jgi:shikimate kinase
MLVYLIGPSGAGKSTIAAGLVLQRPEIRHIDLDTVIRAKDCNLFCHSGDRWKEFWLLTTKCLKELDETSTGISLIDCGAGCLQTDEALSFFQSKSSVIAFVGLSSILFERAKKSKPYWQNRTLEEYEKSELSPYRSKFFAAAQYHFDVGKFLGHEAVNELLKILRKIDKVNVAT